MERKLKAAEFSGIFFILVLSVFFQNLYDLTQRNILGVVFGSVNNSIWEICKTLALAYFFWAAIELLCLKVPLRKFIVSKAAGLSSLIISYILFCLIFAMFSISGYMTEFIAAAVCASGALYLSYAIMRSDRNFDALFLPSLFVLLLFISVYISFTPNPPRLYVFEDRDTGLYGIIPENIDIGAIILDVFFDSAQ